MVSEEQKNNMFEDVQILNVNKERVKDNPIGFEEVKPGKGKQFIKKTTENISKLAIMVAAAVIQIPGMREAVNAFGAMGANGVMGWISKVIGKSNNLPLKEIGGQLVQPEIYMNMSLPEGNLSWLGFLVQFCVNVAVNHPGVVIAGGAALVGLLTNKVFYPIIKRIVRMIKGAYQDKRRVGNANNMQLNIYNLVKQILKHKNFKKAKNHNGFKKTLEDVVRDVEQAQQYPNELMELYTCLQDIYNLVEKNEIKDYNQSIINLQANLKRIEAKSYTEHEVDLKTGRTR